MDVTIKLRAIVKDKIPCLAMFDSNRKGDINNLETVVKAGYKIFWVLDDDPGIGEIIDIYSKEKQSIVFKNGIVRTPKGIELQIPDIIEGVLEAYIIEYILDEKKIKIKIDPYIRIEPPF